MKQLFISVFILISVSLNCFASSINVKIDPRVELTSIVFRMAGAKEYVTDRAPSYLSDVDNYFSEYSNHPLIKYIIEIRDPYRLYYGNVVAISFLFEIENGHVIPLKSDEATSWISRYWNEKSAERYFQLLDSFYSDSNFDLFLEQHREMYNASLDKSRQIVEAMNIDTAWFNSFFGDEMKDIDVNIALLNGQHNYALNDLPASDNCYRVVVGCYSEYNGAPVLSDDCDGVLIHEICHIIGNPIVNGFLDEFVSFDKVYSHIKHMTKEHGYGDNDSITALVESINNMFCTEYLLFSHCLFSGYNISEAEEIGFIWMSDLIHFMDNFHSNKDIYTSIKEFMPQIVAYYNELPDRIDAIILNNAAKKPYVESTYPANNSVVPADIKEIRVTFSQPLIDAYGQRIIDGIDPIPLGDSYRSEDHRTVIVPVTKPLELNKTYGIELEGGMFVSEKTFHRMSNNYKLIFRTK